MKDDLEIIKDQLKEASFDWNSGLAAVPLAEIQDLTPGQAVQYIRSKVGSWDILKEIIASIESEKKYLATNIEDFYFGKIDPAGYGEEGVSPQMINRTIQSLKVRAQRLYMVYTPDFSQTVSINKVTDHTYDMVKIQWVDDYGKRIKKISKTFGKAGESGLAFAIPKLIEDLFPEYTEMIKEHKLSNGIVADFLVRISGVDWIFEWKNNDKSDFIKTAVSMDLWKLYRKTYYK